MRVLVVDDDTRFTSNLIYAFQSFYTVHVAEAARTAMQKLAEQRYDLILLDVNLPDATGIEFFSRIRARNNKTPVIIVSGIADARTKVRLLESGVSDYVTKPIHAEELRARIAIHIKRPLPLPPAGTMRYQDLVLDTSTRQAFHHGRPVLLRGREYDILECLVLNADKTVQAELLGAYVWQDEAIDHNNIHVHMNHLRSKLAQTNVHIRTLYRLGYQLTRRA